MGRLPSPVRWAGVALLFGLFAGAAGCGSGDYGDVQGTVTSRGKPVVWGTVVVIGADHMPRYGVIQQDGSFVVKKVPIGPAQLGVSSPNPSIEPKLKPEERARNDDYRKKAGLETPPKPPKGAWFPIPAKYNDPLKSGLTADVKSPATTVDLKLD